MGGQRVDGQRRLPLDPHHVAAVVVGHQPAPRQRHLARVAALLGLFEPQPVGVGHASAGVRVPGVQAQRAVERRHRLGVGVRRGLPQLIDPLQPLQQGSLVGDRQPGGDLLSDLLGQLLGPPQVDTHLQVPLQRPVALLDPALTLGPPMGSGQIGAHLRGHRTRRRGTPPGLPGQTTQAQVAQVLGDASRWRALRRRGGIALHNSPEQGVPAPLAKRTCQREDLVEDHTQGVDIAGGCGRPEAGDTFGRQVTRGAEHGRRPLALVRAEPSAQRREVVDADPGGKAPVQQQDLAVRAHHHVVRFDVAVDHAPIVGKGHRLTHAHENSQQARRRKGIHIAPFGPAQSAEDP